MLKDSLFKITSINHQQGAVEGLVVLNKSDKIFEGHFPGQPVLPGACMLQMMKEIFEEALNQSLRIKKADQIKFLSLVDPQLNNLLQLKLSYNSLFEEGAFSVTASIIAADTICFKFKGTLVAI